MNGLPYTQLQGWDPRAHSHVRFGGQYNLMAETLFFLPPPTSPPLAAVATARDVHMVWLEVYPQVNVAALQPSRNRVQCMQLRQGDAAFRGLKQVVRRQYIASSSPVIYH